ncbi:MAG: oligoendopeptidase F [Pelosinus sp.]|nr:oligoendopeptidase F [Pelosinus sp.]
MNKKISLACCLCGTMLFSPSTLAANDTLPERGQVSSAYKWHLEDIYNSEQAWQKDAEKLKDLLIKLAPYQGKLKESPAKLSACLKLQDEINILVGEKLYPYARMRQDENTANNTYQALTGKAQALLSEAGAATSFIEPEILAIPEERLAKFRQQEPALLPYAYYLDTLKLRKVHILSPQLEEMLSRTTDVAEAPASIYNTLTGADMTFPVIKDEENSEVQLSAGRYINFLRSQSRSVRMAAFESYHNTYHQYRNTLAATLNAYVKKNIFYAKARNYPSALAASLEQNQIPVSVYDTLITTVNNHLDPLHRYVNLKKKVLKLENIHMYDLYVPLIGDVTFHIPYEQGMDMVKNALTVLGPDYSANLNKALTSGWIDVQETKNKRSGAYSWGVYGIHPFILLNYNENLGDASTLAHELGHTMHSFYSSTNQPYINSQYSIFTAETASTTNELLFQHYLMQQTTDKQQKIYLLNQALEDLRATLYRQTMFAEFEKAIYEKAEKGETLTADLLERIYHELNVKYFGPEMVVDKDIDIEWARIPHFYGNFYVYQYATGYSAATALSEQILTQGKPAADRYINEFLKRGGSDTPINILTRAGVDMSSPQPIEITLNKFSAIVDELEKLLTK